MTFHFKHVTKLSKIVPAKKRPPLDALTRAFYSGVMHLTSTIIN